ncbi:MAG: response regulator [Chitinispirillaceae bacterium]|nr:response regulator [Chitinispirillaceae bacterium]
MEGKYAEEAQKKNARLLRDTSETAKIGGWEFDVETLEQVWTEEVYRIHEVDMTYKPTVRKGMNFYTPASRPIIEQAVQRAIEHGDPFDLELEFITVKGNLRWVRVAGKADREHGKIFGTFQDITERKQTEIALHESEERYRRITKDWQETFDTINEAITIHDTDFNVVRANKTSEIMLGKNAREILSAKCFSLYHDKKCPLQGCPCAESLKTGKPSTVELFEPHLNKFLEIKALPRFDEKNNMTGLVHIVRDISEITKLTDQFHQAQKMEAIGQLAGGVAHDFNNLLMIISGYGDLIKSGLPEDNGLQKFAQQIVETSLKGGQLTRKLLAFARKGKYVTTMVDVHGVMDSVIDLLRHSIDRRINIERKYRAEPSIVIADAYQLENALLNLGINSRDAMPDGGVLTFETDHVSLDAAYCRRQPVERIPGNYLRICVSDSGTGMDEETQKHLFEPFFTTKEAGKGTGLGLAGVYGFVKQNNGFINVYSVAGKGTTIKFHLPAAVKTEIAVKTPVIVETVKGHGHILFVDDEPALRKIGFLFLTELGYRVTCCGDGAEAIEYFGENWRDVDLIILDMIMPKMDGLDCYNRIKEISNTVPVLATSGFGMNTEIRNIVDAGVKGFLQKPFQMEKLAKVISDTMG